MRIPNKNVYIINNVVYNARLKRVAIADVAAYNGWPFNDLARAFLQKRSRAFMRSERSRQVASWARSWWTAAAGEPLP